MRIKPKNFIAVIIISAVHMINTHAQESPIHYQSQYLFNPYLINPAIAGSKDYTVIQLSARQNLSGIAGAPKTQILSSHSRLRRYMKGKTTYDKGSEYSNMGIGGYVYNDVAGPLRKFGFQATYAYHLPLSRRALRHLAFGISFNGFLYSINYGELNVLIDPLIEEGTNQAFVPDANLGIYYYGTNLFGGISSSSILETPVKWQNESYDQIELKRNYFLMLGYKILATSELVIEPSFLVKTDDETLSEFYKSMDFNLKVYYSSFFIGTSYRMNKGVVVWGQYHYRNFTVGLAYEFPLSDVTNYYFGTTEIIVGFNLGLGRNRFGDRRYW